MLLQYLDTLKGGFDGADADTRLEEIKLLLPRLEMSHRHANGLLTWYGLCSHRRHNKMLRPRSSFHPER